MSVLLSASYGMLRYVLGLYFGLAGTIRYLKRHMYTCADTTYQRELYQ